MDPMLLKKKVLSKRYSLPDFLSTAVCRYSDYADYETKFTETDRYSKGYVLV